MRKHRNPDAPAPRLPDFGVGPADDLIASSAQEAHQLDVEERGRESRSARIADYVTAKLGSMGFMLLNIIWFAAWIAVNLPGSPWQFDPFPFSFLTMAVSLEAIALSIFVLISENAQAKRADRRARIDMQVNIIAEREVTALVKLVSQIHEHLGLNPSAPDTLREMAAETPLSAVAQSVEDDEAAAPQKQAQATA